MAKKKQQVPATPLRVGLGEELVASVREMKANVRARSHQPVVSSITSARVASGLSHAHNKPKNQ